MSNLSSATFGFTFGLIWTTPILMLAGLPKDAWRPELAVKLSAIVALEVVFCLFPFWHGATGIPGQRYILPYLVILLPEMCAGLAGLVARSRAFLLAPVACTVLFLPALDFRNTFADSYPPAAMQGQSRIEFGLEHFPVADWSFHPGMFAWRLVIARLSGDATFPSALSGGPLLNPSAVIPMTGISRIIDAVNAPAIHDDPRFDRVRKIFSGWPARLLELVRGGLALGLMVALVNIAYRLGRQTRTTGKIVPS